MPNQSRDSAEKVAGKCFVSTPTGLSLTCLSLAPTTPSVPAWLAAEPAAGPARNAADGAQSSMSPTPAPSLPGAVGAAMRTPPLSGVFPPGSDQGVSHG